MEVEGFFLPKPGAPLHRFTSCPGIGRGPDDQRCGAAPPPFGEAQLTGHPWGARSPPGAGRTICLSVWPPKRPEGPTSGVRRIYRRKMLWSSRARRGRARSPACRRRRGGPARRLSETAAAGSFGASPSRSVSTVDRLSTHAEREWPAGRFFVCPGGRRPPWGAADAPPTRGRHVARNRDREVVLPREGLRLRPKGER